ncbi:MAG: hypothetical protein KAY96_02425 [Bacteroidia bacterium]|jgi:hypothetical protein|nr:hypothetical protein [Bacteroidota bacterium]MBP6640542.1 hypothetical protein [Bacteroidia bacterium]MBP8073588.1 hypothetical protein [Bacteroidia bacterium]
MRNLICTLCLLLLFATAWGQTAEIVLKNGIKTNLLGPVMVIRAGTLQFFWWNADLRYERKMPNIQYLSIVGEVMFSKRPDVFSVYNPNGNWMDFAVSHQMDLNLLAGPRLTKGLIKRDGFGLGLYAELRAGIVASHAKFQDAGGMTDYGRKNRLGATARLRGGVEFRILRRIGLEISGDVGPYRLLGSDIYKIDAYPEVSLGVWF